MKITLCKQNGQWGIKFDTRKITFSLTCVDKGVFDINDVMHFQEYLEESEYDTLTSELEKIVIDRNEYSIYAMYDHGDYEYWNHQAHCNNPNFVIMTLRFNQSILPANFNYAQLEKDIYTFVTKIESLHGLD